METQYGRTNRDQRSIRGGPSSHCQGARSSGRYHQRRRRCHCPRTSDWSDWGDINGAFASLDETRRFEPRGRYALYRWRARDRLGARDGVGLNREVSAFAEPMARQAILMRRYLLAVAFCSCFAIWSTDLKAKARVEYVRPENFTDVSFRSMTHQAAEERLERELTKTIETAAAQYSSPYQLDV